VLDTRDDEDKRVDDSNPRDDVLVSGMHRAGFGKVLYVEPRDV